MAAYSFADVFASISGPNGSFQIGGGGAGNAKEGLTCGFVEDKNNMAIGAGGEGMHSLHASRGGRVTIRLLKTSPVNALLSALYSDDEASGGSLWGQNTITVTNKASGDNYLCLFCAFTKFPDNTYAEDGGTLEWAFDSISVNPILATGIPLAA